MRTSFDQVGRRLISRIPATLGPQGFLSNGKNPTDKGDSVRYALLDTVTALTISEQSWSGELSAWLDSCTK